MAGKKKTENAIVIIALNDSVELADALKKIGDAQRLKTEIQSKADAQIADLQLAVAAQIDVLDEEIKKWSHSIKHYSDANRLKLFGDDKKTAYLPTGELSYRLNPPSVNATNSVATINKVLEKNELIDYREKVAKKFAKVYLRMKLELDKDDILKYPEDAKEKTGIEVQSNLEKFYLKPSETSTELEVV